jgi:hypothetical protein
MAGQVLSESADERTLRRITVIIVYLDLLGRKARFLSFSYRQGAQAKACLLKDSYGSMVEGITQFGKVGCDEGYLGLRPALAQPPEKNDGGCLLLSQGQYCSEVGIGGHNRSPLARSPIKNDLIL